MKKPIALLYVFISLCALSCGESAGSEPTPPSRVNAVMASTPAGDATTWCDVYFAPGKGPKLRLPATVDAATGREGIPVKSGAGWIWLNLWATWCGPCLREMPLVVKWRDVYERDGIAVSQYFISIDEDADNLKEFMADRSAPPLSSLHIPDEAAVQPWLVSLGLKADSSIPINIFATENQEVRCIRTGEILDGHFPTLKALLASSPR